MSKKTAVGKDIRQLFKVPEFWVGIALLILSLLLGWGLPMITAPTPHNGILITIGGFLISVPLFLRAYQLYAYLKIKKRTWGIVIAVIIGLLILVITQLQFTQARPKLRIDFDSSSIITSTGEIKFRIVNNGQSAAYKYYPIMFAAPANKVEEVMIASKRPSTNSMEPTESIYLSANITQPNKVTGVWYLYFKLIYSDSATGGRLYIDDSPYWLSCDFDNPHNGFVELTPVQRDILEAAIKACYPSARIS